VEVGSKGFAITSPDKQYSVRVRGYVQADNRTFFGNSATGAATDTFLVRAARPVIDAKMTDYFDGRMMIDFGRGNTTLLDAYGDFHPMPGNPIVNLRLGEFKVPVGLERWQSEQELLFVERGPTTNLVPYRDIGLMGYGQLVPGQLEYQLALLNGASDSQTNTGDSDNTKDVAGRLFAHPFRWSGISALQGLGVGVGGTYGQHHGSSTTPNLTAGYVSVGQRTYFTYRTNSGQVAFADGPQWRINPQAYYYNGPFGAIAEYVLNQQEIARSASIRDNIRNNAWMGVATYVVTGEDASFDGVKPAHDFAPSKGDWGAFELTGRYGQLNVDRKAFPLFADPSASARAAREVTGGVNWYLNPSIKLNLDFSFTSFDGGRAGGLDRKDEKALLTRTQFRF
jgi:phosphate-selective porin OprO/OprP